MHIQKWGETRRQKKIIKNKLIKEWNLIVAYQIFIHFVPPQNTHTHTRTSMWSGGMETIANTMMPFCVSIRCFLSFPLAFVRRRWTSLAMASNWPAWIDIIYLFLFKHQHHGSPCNSTPGQLFYNIFDKACVCAVCGVAWPDTRRSGTFQAAINLLTVTPALHLPLTISTIKLKKITCNQGQMPPPQWATVWANGGMLKTIANNLTHFFLESTKANKSNKRWSDLNRNLSPNKATDLRVARLGGHNTMHSKKHKKSKSKPGRVEWRSKIYLWLLKIKHNRHRIE